MKQRQNPNTDVKLRLKLVVFPTTDQLVALPGAAPGPSCHGWNQISEVGGALSSHLRPPQGHSDCKRKSFHPGGSVALIRLRPLPFLLLCGPWAEGVQDTGSAGRGGAVRYWVGQRQIHYRTVHHMVQAGWVAGSRVASAVAAVGGVQEHCRGTAGRQGAALGPDWRRSCSHPSPPERCDEGSVLGTSGLR